MTREFQFDDWRIAWDADDGGRLTALSWRGRELLTAAPRAFRPPAADFGRFETRPVYGYDDCFPTVDACRLDEPAFEAPDHGELCWLAAKAEGGAGVLRTRWVCRTWPAVFERELRVKDNRLLWHFRVENTGTAPWPYLHVMHALMPPEGLTALRLPRFQEAYDEIANTVLGPFGGWPPEERLLATPAGTARMWLLRGVNEGWAQASWKGGLRLTIRFPVDRFPTLGIWWNRRGYPGDGDARRDEFALEPIPGPYSSLARCAAAGSVFTVAPRKSAQWIVEWELDQADTGKGP